MPEYWKERVRAEKLKKGVVWGSDDVIRIKR